jgi:hypothetical protein
MTEAKNNNRADNALISFGPKDDDAQRNGYGKAPNGGGQE